MSAVIGIVSQIAEAERELALRHNVYRKQVDAKTITQEQANLLIGRMEAIIKTLRFVQTHEAGFREFIACKKNPEKETSLGPRIRGDDDGDIAANLKKAVAGLAGAEFIIASQIEEVNLALQLYRTKSSSVQGYRTVRMQAVAATLQRLQDLVTAK